MVFIFTCDGQRIVFGHVASRSPHRAAVPAAIRAPHVVHPKQI